MTDPTRPTDAELEAGHTKLLAADYTFTIAAAIPTRSTAHLRQVLGRTVRAQLPPDAPEFVDIAAPGLTTEEATELRARFLERYPELAAYYEGMRSKIKEPVWTARQQPRPKVEPK